jgi:acetoin utilization deacetylase AcuC-like enzyme
MTAPLSDSQAVDHAITSRMSTRAFTNQAVPKALITEILQVASRAPSGTNTQPWKVYVLQGNSRDTLVEKVCAAHDASRANPEVANQYQDTYLEALDKALENLENSFEPSLVIYLAGADPHEGDRLGRLKLTFDGLEARDRRVFDWAFQKGIPMAFAMAGGYGENIADTVQVQMNTYRVAYAYWQRWQNRNL